jgi:hypothetical protein
VSWFLDAMTRVAERMLQGVSMDWVDDATARAERRSETPDPAGATGLWTGTSKAPGRRGQVDAWCMKSGCVHYGEQVSLWHVHEPVYPHHEKSE